MPSFYKQTMCNFINAKILFIIKEISFMHFFFSYVIIICSFLSFSFLSHSHILRFKVIIACIKCNLITSYSHIPIFLSSSFYFIYLFFLSYLLDLILEDSFIIFFNLYIYVLVIYIYFFIIYIYIYILL